MKGSCDSMPHLANESFLTKEQQDRLKGTFDDFVAVVRCKDCKYYRDQKPITYGGCATWMGKEECVAWAEEGVKTDPNGWCYKAERE